MRLISTTSKERAPSHQARTAGVHKFVAIDGEADNSLPGSPYVLLSVGQDHIENKQGIHWREAFEFIYSHFERHTAYVGFFLSYDFTQMFKSLPKNKAWSLLMKDGIANRQRGIQSNGRRPVPFPVECDGWQFDLLAGKRLRIRPKNCDCTKVFCSCDKMPWMYICDVGGFFQTSFLSVIDPRKWPEPIVTDKEWRILKEGKDSRETAKLGPAMRRYNALENEVLERVMQTLDKGLRSIGIFLSPSKWFGPGQAAQAWLQTCAPIGDEIKDACPKWFLDAAGWSYIGGWFELMMHGIIWGITWEYDINSAYPFIIANLPCLLHGKWTRGQHEAGHPDGEFMLVRATVKGTTDASGHAYIGAMPHRNKRGHISRPMVTSSWYWWHELKAAMDADCVYEYEIHEWMNYEPCNCPGPICGVADLYQMRLDIGKDSPLGKAAKLVYNSEYGKFAQSIGSPLFGNPIYASLITSGCRTQILNAIATHPGGKSAVAMVATDAVYFTSPHPTLPISNKLGDWECKERTNLTLFKPGVYWDDSTRAMIKEGKAPTFKSRGVNAKDLAKKIGIIDAQFMAWNGKPPVISEWNEALEGYTANDKWPAVQFTPSFQMVTALQALMRDDWSLAGTRFSRPVKQSSNPYQKRTRAYWDGKYYRSEPLDNGKISQAYDDVASIPYSKKFGMESLEDIMTERKEELGITPDGYAVSRLFDWTREL